MSRFDLDASPRYLLSTGNPKTAKGEGHGWLTAILHLAPADRSDVVNVCPHASAGCRVACLNEAGRGGIALDADRLNVIQTARIQRTRLFKRDRAEFLARLVADMERHVRDAARHGLRPAARLNGTSDLPWERFPVIRDGVRFASIMAAFPEVRFYDYTKWPPHLRGRRGQLPANYSLTFSLSESNDERALAALDAGVNVAAVFAVRKGQPLPTSFLGRPVIDGDLSDLRFTDPTGVIVGLRAKGPAINDDSGFVRTI